MQRAKPLLMGGQPVRLLHKEADGYITSDHRRAELGLSVYVQKDDPASAHGSSNTVWQVEKATPHKAFDGTACTWEGAVRIRHLATGRLLAVDNAAAGATGERSSEGNGGDAGGGGGGGAIGAAGGREGVSARTSIGGVPPLSLTPTRQSSGNSGRGSRVSIGGPGSARGMPPRKPSMGLVRQASRQSLPPALLARASDGALGGAGGGTPRGMGSPPPLEDEEPEVRRTVLRRGDDYSADTLFKLEPQYPQEGAIEIDKFLRIVHIVTGMWLHYDSAPPPAPPPPPPPPPPQPPPPQTDVPEGAEAPPPLKSIVSGEFLPGLAGSSAGSQAAASSPRGRKESLSALQKILKAGAAQAKDGHISTLAHDKESLQTILDDDQMGGRLEALGAGGRALVATRALHDEDVFGLQPVGQAQFDDLVYVNSCASIFRSFLEQFSGANGAAPPHRSQVDLGPITQVLGQMIVFVTISDNPNVHTREGLPHAARQLLLREQQILDLAMQCVNAPFKSTFNFESDLATPEARRNPANAALYSMAVLAQRLSRHTLRECVPNKTYAMRFVHQLQSQLSYGIFAANTLTEVFADNEALLETVDDDIVLMFVRLLREQARLARFVDFLIVLCQCKGKAVRINQWRVCRLLIVEAPELLLKLSLSRTAAGSAATPAKGKPPPQQVIVSGDVRYFPAFKGEASMELSRWLSVTTAENAAYFERTMALYAVLVRGRNLRNTPAVSRLLPYPLCVAIVTSPQLHATHLEVSTQFVGIVRDLYVDNEPNELMTRVKTVRIWANVQPAAQSGKLSSRLTTVLDIDWKRFNGLKAFVLEYVSRFFDQTATRIKENEMVLQQLQLLYYLIQGGFYTSDEVTEIRAPLLSLLDGRGDKVGLTPNEAPTDRYKQWKTLKCDTVVIMNCKSWLCRILQLLCTMRLDIRLSQLLARYDDEWRQGAWDKDEKDDDDDDDASEFAFARFGSFRPDKKCARALAHDLSRQLSSARPARAPPHATAATHASALRLARRPALHRLLRCL